MKEQARASLISSDSARSKLFRRQATIQVPASSEDPWLSSAHYAHRDSIVSRRNRCFRTRHKPLLQCRCDIINLCRFQDKKEMICVHIAAEKNSRSLQQHMQLYSVIARIKSRICIPTAKMDRKSENNG